jgi:hypothetical protein
MPIMIVTIYAPWVVSRHDQFPQCTRDKPKYDPGYNRYLLLTTLFSG